MAYLDTFHVVVGETIMHCQRIEHDVKLIYAGMIKGDFKENLSTVKNEALGTVLVALEELDNSDGHPYFDKNDYKLLKQIKNVRNWLAHTAYADFIYSKGAEWENKLDASYAKLLDFNNKMKRLGDMVEKVRIDILRRYGRI